LSHSFPKDSIQPMWTPANGVHLAFSGLRGRILVRYRYIRGLDSPFRGACGVHGPSCAWDPDSQLCQICGFVAPALALVKGSEMEEVQLRWRVQALATRFVEVKD